MKLIERAKALTELNEEEILRKYCVHDFGIKQISNRRCRPHECKECWNKYEVEVS